MCVFDFLFSLPVLVAVAWRFCMTNAQPPKKKKKKNWGQQLSLSLCAHRTQTRRKRGLFLVVLFSVCVPSGLAVSVCVLCATSVRRRFWMLPGAWLFVCVFLSKARARSLTFGSLTLSLSRSVSLSPLFLSLALSLISTSVWLLLPESIIFYYVLFCFL